MDIAIVTGAETPLGLRIVQSLVQQGCRVHGIGNNFSKVTYADPQFKAHPVDLTNIEAVRSALTDILEAEGRLHLLVHAIDVTPGAAFDKLSVGNLEAILKIGVLGPVMMTRLAMPNLLRFRGQLINVIPANKSGHPASALNALIEGGLREMNKALFDQGRDAGLRITNCVLRQNTKLSGARVGDDVLEQNHIDLDDLARTIEQLIDPKAVNVPAEVLLYPRLSPGAETGLPEAPLPLDPYSEVVLPPKEYHPPEQPKIPTAQKQQIERTIPYTDEEMEDKIAAAIEDFEANPERYERPDPKPQQNPRPSGQSGQEQQGQQAQQGEGKNKRRRRRRGGRNRNKKPQDGESPKPEGGFRPKDDAQAKPAKPSQDSASQDNAKDNAKEPTQGAPNRSAKKKPARKADEAQSENVVKKTAKKAARKVAKKAVKKSAKASSPSAGAEQAAPAPKKPVKKAAKKKAAKKAAKKKAAKTTS